MTPLRDLPYHLRFRLYSLIDRITQGIADRVLSFLEDRSSPACTRCLNGDPGGLTRPAGGHWQCTDRAACAARTPGNWREFRARQHEIASQSGKKAEGQR